MQEQWVRWLIDSFKWVKWLTRGLTDSLKMSQVTHLQIKWVKWSIYLSHMTHLFESLDSQKWVIGFVHIPTHHDILVSQLTRTWWVTWLNMECSWVSWLSTDESHDSNWNVWKSPLHCVALVKSIHAWWKNCTGWSPLWINSHNECCEDWHAFQLK